MKKLIFTAVVVLCWLDVSKAAPLVSEAPINGYGTPVTVSISSTTLTKVPTTQTSGRMGVYVTNSSTRPVAGFLGDCTSTALASTIRPIQFSQSSADVVPSGPQFFPLREDVCLWLISILTNTASQDIHYQEIKK